jgi:hypothetical protein
MDAAAADWCDGSGLLIRKQHQKQLLMGGDTAMFSLLGGL